VNKALELTPIAIQRRVGRLEDRVVMKALLSEIAEQNSSLNIPFVAVGGSAARRKMPRSATPMSRMRGCG
jgi:hypothetical protein